MPCAPSRPLLRRRRVIGHCGSALLAALPAHWSLAVTRAPAFVAGGGAAAANPAAAAVPSARPLRLLVAAPPGSSVDLSARLIADRVHARAGPAFVIDNRAGAGGTLAAAEVARAAPDGATLLAGFNGPLATAGLLYPRLPYRPQDLVPVIATVSQPHVMVVAAAHPARDVADFIRRARAAPGRWNYASVGQGTASHLAMELFKAETGVYVVHIPYSGGPAALQALIAAEVDVLFTAWANAQPLVEAGRVRVLARADAAPDRLTPGVPTMAQVGFPSVQAPLFNGIVAPPGTPATVVRRLNSAIAEALAEPAVEQRLQAAGMGVIGGAPEVLERLVRSEVNRWAPIVRRLQLTLE